MNEKGLTLIEIIIVLAIIGILAAGGFKLFSPTPEARMVACSGDLKALNENVEMLFMDSNFTKPPTFEQVLEESRGAWKKHYHYVANLGDANAGHGNDIDFCDEENPGVSIEDRDCLDMEWIIVCDHNHGDLAEFNFIMDGNSLFAMPIGTFDKKEFEAQETPNFLKDLTWWGGIRFYREDFINFAAKQ